jgi:hypothetical protein
MQLCVTALLLPAFTPEGGTGGVVRRVATGTARAAGDALVDKAFWPVIGLLAATAVLWVARRAVDRLIGKLYRGSWPPPRNVEP